MNWNWRMELEVISLSPVHLTACIPPDRDNSLLVIHSFVLSLTPSDMALLCTLLPRNHRQNLKHTPLYLVIALRKAYHPETAYMGVLCRQHAGEMPLKWLHDLLPKEEKKASNTKHPIHDFLGETMSPKLLLPLAPSFCNVGVVAVPSC